MSTANREFKDVLYREFARIGHAVSAPKRIELLDLLSQGEKRVEQLAEQMNTPIKNTSAQLRVLHQARLVETRREGTYVYYRVAADNVAQFVRSLQALGHSQLAEVEQVANLYLTNRDELEAVTLDELQRLVRDEDVTVLDVRPTLEYEAGHIPGAISLPITDLDRRLRELPRSKTVVAYCRGPYCVFSLEAVTVLRKRGYHARRTDAGLTDWRARGLPVAYGPDAVSQRSRRRPPRKHAIRRGKP
jgi:rhodanese-related sulfurtransferase